MTEQNRQIESLDRIIIETLGKTEKSMKIPIRVGRERENYFQFAARKEKLMKNLKQLGYHEEEIEKRLDYHITEGNLVTYCFHGRDNGKVILIAVHPSIVKKHNIPYDM